jgi:uncharacterized protein (TIGR00369 family)
MATGVLDLADVASLSGLEAMRAVASGKVPGPAMARTLNFDLVEVGEGLAIFEGEPTEAFLNPMGGVHGGWALSMIDSATGCAGHTTLPAGHRFTSIETKVNFVRAITPQTGKVRCEGRVISAGRTIITTEAKLTDAGGKVLAHGTSTLLVLKPQGKE